MRCVHRPAVVKQISHRASTYCQGLRKIYSERQQLQEVLRADVSNYKVDMQITTMTGPDPRPPPKR